MSGFVYRVQVDGRVLIKKEVPGPDTINEFIYEINALHTLQYSDSVIDFFGVVVDDEDEHVKGLLISYAERGTLVDIIYDHQPGNEKGLLPLPWTVRATWARQVVQGLADVHESGFVQGDFTLSNIVIDRAGNAKIIDINRRGCPVGWEPPESRPLVKSSQGISMYIGVKSDLYQLGMVLWALAMEEDEPEKYGPGLVLPADADIPSWYRRLVDICLSDDPRMRLQASSLLSLFPPALKANGMALHMEPGPVGYDDRPTRSYSAGEYQTNGRHRIRTVSPSDRSSYNFGATPLDARSATCESSYSYPTRGRSPPSPLPSNCAHYDIYRAQYRSSWAIAGNKASYSDSGEEDGRDTGINKKGRMGKPAFRVRESESNQSPRGSLPSAEVHGHVGGEQEAPSHLLTSDEASNRPELRKEKEAVVRWDGTQVNNAADRENADRSQKSTDADEGAMSRPTESVGGETKRNFTNKAVGTVSDMGITGPNDPTTRESQYAPSIVPARVLSEGRENLRGPTEPETARSKPDSARSPPADRSTERNSSERRHVARDDVEEAPRSSSACDNGIGRVGACENPSDGSISVLTGVGGIDGDGQGDPTQYPTSLEDEPGLMPVPTRLTTKRSEPRGPEETIPSPISVGN